MKFKTLERKMIFVFVLLLFCHSHGENLTMHDFNARLLSMENKIHYLESEVKFLKSRDVNSESKIELKELQADVSYILMEQSKVNERERLLRLNKYFIDIIFNEAL